MPVMFEDYGVVLLRVPPILFAITVHEFAHGWAAFRLGDPTPALAGRLTLNPLRHLDLFGTFALFLTGMFGWARPVPINPRNFANPSRAVMLVGLAGPASNLMLAAVFSLLQRAMLDYAAPFSPSTALLALFFMVRTGVVVNVALAVFNMIPIPPLDGSRVLAHFLPPGAHVTYSRMEPYGFMILITLMLTGVIGRVMSPLVLYAMRILSWGLA